MNNNPKIFFIVGKSGIGKSVYANTLMHELIKNGVTVGGFIVNKKSELKKSLYLISLNEEIDFIDKENRNWIPYRSYFFNPNGFIKGEHVLLNDIEHKDVIIIDEVGPMELSELGWHDILKKMIETRNNIYVWVVKQKLIHQIQMKFGFKIISFINVEKQSKKHSIFLNEILKNI